MMTRDMFLFSLICFNARLLLWLFMYVFLIGRIAMTFLISVSLLNTSMGVHFYILANARHFA